MPRYLYQKADHVGLIHDQPNETYHSSDGVSKSFVWDMETKTPYAAKFRSRKSTAALEVGTAAHIAILQPEELEAKIARGPADRRGKKWEEAQDWAAHTQRLLLTEGDYDEMLMIRDAADLVPQLRLMRDLDSDGKGPVIETTCQALDEETGLLLRCRPDLYSRRHGLMLDLKNMADASKPAWEKAVASYGYHMQDAFYSDVWTKGSGLPLEGFWFCVFEKGDPPQVALYELSADAIAEGVARYRRGLARIAECERTNDWPGYPLEIQQCDMAYWGYQINPAPART